MANKTRLEKLEQRAKPTGKLKVVWSDPDKAGVFYDHPYSEPTRKQLTEDELNALRNDPDITLFEVVYTDDWRGPARDLD